MQDDEFLAQLSALAPRITEAYPRWRVFRKSLSPDQRNWQVFADMLYAMVATSHNVRKMGSSGLRFSLGAPPAYERGDLVMMRNYHLHNLICQDIGLILQYGALLHSWRYAQAVETLQQFLDTFQLDRGQVVELVLAQLARRSGAEKRAGE